MSAPMKPHEAAAYAALVVSDPEAAMRKELEDMIEIIVRRQVRDSIERMTGNGELQYIAERAFRERERRLRSAKDLM